MRITFYCCYWRFVEKRRTFSGKKQSRLAEARIREFLENLKRVWFKQKKRVHGTLSTQKILTTDNCDTIGNFYLCLRVHCIFNLWINKIHPSNPLSIFMSLSNKPPPRTLEKLLVWNGHIKKFLNKIDREDEIILISQATVAEYWTKRFVGFLKKSLAIPWAFFFKFIIKTLNNLTTCRKFLNLLNLRIKHVI